MDSWMDERIYLRNVLCITNACVCICAGFIYGNYVHTNLCMGV